MSCPNEALEAQAVTVDSVWSDQHELINTITHGSGAVLAMAASVALVSQAISSGNLGNTAACVVYALTLVGVYTASTLSHCVFEPARRQWCRRLDQGLIFLLIAGTYTPFAFAYLHGSIAGWILTTAMWLVAWYGFSQKVVFTGYVDRTVMPIYLALGWMPLLAFPFIRGLVPLHVFLWILAGGVIYSIGTIFLMIDSRRFYFHAIWHLLVIAASVVHFTAVYWFVAVG